MRSQISTRLDVTLPLAQFYVTQARVSGDLRFLGYAEATLQPWIQRQSPPASALVLEATVLQSRHEFAGALAVLDRAIALRPDDPQTWLTRATVERVLGDYEQAQLSCTHIRDADPVVAQVCAWGIYGLEGQLPAAAAALQALPEDRLSIEAQGWRWSELGDMAMRLGDESKAEHAYREALRRIPSDAYSRTAYADLLLQQHRPREVLDLLADGATIEPMLLRIALAEQQLSDTGLQSSREELASAFSVEDRRGEAVHRREQARFLLDIERDAAAALRAAMANWRVQREPADALILLRAAAAANQVEAAQPAREFVRHHGTQDVRFTPYLRSGR